LLVVTVMVIVAHAVLLLGWPHLYSQERKGLDGSAFMTRLVTVPAAPNPEPGTPKPPPQSAVERPKTIPKPQKQPQPRRPVEPAKRPPEPPTEPAAPTETPVSPAAVPNDVVQTPDLSGGTAMASLLRPKPAVTFGGGSAPEPIDLPLSSEATDAAIKSVQTQDQKQIQLPRSALLTYSAQGTVDNQSFQVSSTLNWRQDGRLYDARWVLYSPRVGEFTRVSTGLIAPQGIVPVVASLRTPQEHIIRFDHEAQRVRVDEGNNDTQLTPGTQDRLGALIQLGAMLSSDQARATTGQTIELPAAHLQSVGRWVFIVQGDENIPALRQDAVPTVRLLHSPQSEKDARIEVWLGRTLDFLPVRLRVTEPNGDTVEYNVQTAYTQQVPAAAAPPPAASEARAQ
jgi:outer membrane biosynthesis protein TonB